MARKRMLDPDFWKDLRIRKLSFTERLFFLGCVSAADDEGRLIGDPAHLRSEIFRYDDITTEDVEKMRDYVAEVVPGFVVYRDDGEVYIAFRKWATYQKPSYAKPSTLPVPPFVRDSSEKDQGGASAASEPRPQDSIGKDSIGKDSSGDGPPPFSVIFTKITGVLVATGIQAQEMDAWMEDVPEQWFREACTAAVDNNARKWAYVRAVLKRCKAEGKAPGKANSGAHSGRGLTEQQKAFDEAAERGTAEINAG